MKAPVETIIRDLSELKEYARAFIALHPTGSVVGLSGELGAGKTAFVRACVEALSENLGLSLPRVTSPTYVIHQRYTLGEKRIDHFDLYRLENISSVGLDELHYFDIIEESKALAGFVFVEWPEQCIKSVNLGLIKRLEITVKNEWRYVNECLC